jgi:(E)-4-hydroxy-3-methylbut-2-enyl-diphosphate synthase
MVPGLIKSTLGLVPLLRDGIGDTIRYSLSGELTAEVLAARTLLQELGLRHGVRLISCPTCGRARWNVAEVANQILNDTARFHSDVTVAIMGCEVNGPGEARDADLGLAGSGQYIVLFEKGQIVAKGTAFDMVQELMKRLRRN